RKCIEFAAVIKEHGGDRIGVPRSTIAKELEKSGASSGFQLLAASAKIFGITEGHGDTRLTALARSYFFPTNERESRSAELAFMIEPPVFAELVKRLDGAKLPNTSILSNILSQMGVTESWRMRAAQIFSSTAAELNVIDRLGFLRYEAACNAAALGEPRPQPPERTNDNQNATQQTAPTHEPEQRITAKGNVWVYSEGGGTVRLETTDPLPRELWARLKRYVEVLNPSPEQTKEANDGSK
ncbi:MAG TPA: hypothetical protein VGY55_02520, partial [Pirellulales bacterium]|nr:hypothetical protein [Pirellulales bacterium]